MASGKEEDAFPEGVVLQPLETNLLAFAGEKDFKNRYASTVMVRPHEPLEGTRCTGVLIGQRLVLTAAHCVCRKACSKRAAATTVLYGTARTEDLADLRIHTYEGVVRPHPEFSITLDANQNVLAAREDLAVLVLDEPVEEGLVEALGGDEEVQPGEVLLMAGYGQDKAIPGISAARYFRKNRVAASAPPSSGRFLYKQEGAYLYHGFNGGPCFREGAQGRQLVGISSLGSEKELSFTSLYPYREWLDAERQHAGAP